ncbi:DUF7260 family protein [Halobacterium hubeiense]|uniref:DUF7260 family protein n=1 Tax=Halobacterium hubeiense TaxID=1407499 RepID=UPI003C766726
MPTDRHLDDARDLARSEREAVTAKFEAYDQFTARVQNLSIDATHASQSAPALATGGAQTAKTTANADTGCASVRAAFRDTIRPYSVADLDDDEPLLETIRSELSDSIAVAVAPTTDASFTESLRDAIIAATQSRRLEARAMQTGLDAELDHLHDAADTLDQILDWLLDADETPLTDLDFDDLRARHETLATHRERCTRLLADRQRFLDKSPKIDGQEGMSHRTLVRYLYYDLPVAFPVLSAGVHVETLCADSQLAIRDHLTRRV